MNPVPQTDSPLLGKAVAVTGATGGLGRSLVRSLVASGATVAATGSDAVKLADLADELPMVATQTADITAEPDVQAFYEFARGRVGPLDAVVNLAGLSVPGQLEDTDAASLERVISVNVLGTVLSCKHALPALAENGALLINVGSLAGLRPNATAPLYCTAKAAVAMFSKALALQLQAKNVRVTNVSPGGTDTGFWGDRPVDRSKLMAAQDVVDALLFILTRPQHVVVHDLQFEFFTTT